MRSSRGTIFSRSLTAAVFAASIHSNAAAAKVDYARDIAPLFKEHCVECHGPSQQMRGFRLDRRKDALPNRIGANGVRIVPGKSEASILYQRLSGTQAGARMPPSNPLSEQQIQLIRQWIDEGADWPDAFSGDRSATPPDATVERMADALRLGRYEQFRSLLQTHPNSVNARGRAGWTPLMAAALYATAGEVRQLLEKGANPNLVNDDGATALLYAVDDPAKLRVLLEKGADPNLRSGIGRTALLIAAGLNGTRESVNLLLDKGADVKATLPSGQGAISFAVFAGNADVLPLLLDRGANPRPLALQAASKCPVCLDRLLPLADQRDLSSALQGAVTIGDLPLVQQLLKQGAKPAPRLLQLAAIHPRVLPAETIREFIHDGAPLDAKTGTGITLIDFASRQGNTEMVQILREAGVRDEILQPPALTPNPAPNVRAAIERSLPLLQRSDVTFLAKAGCVSCHNNNLTAMTVEAAQSKGIRVDNRIAQSQARKIAAFLDANGPGGLENLGIPGSQDTVSYILLGLAAARYPSDRITDVWARYLKNIQRSDGSWRVLAGRPPIESSDIEVTAASLRSLQVYAIPGQRIAYEKAVGAAVHWIEQATPRTTEDYAFKLLGLTWGKGSKRIVQDTAQELLALQREDGGWAQTPHLKSDAYATGQALHALHTANTLYVNDPRYQRGVRHLLQNQLADGSWYVRTRSPAFQPYFDSDFPHGHDQFISAAATNWAVLALTAAVR